MLKMHAYDAGIHVGTSSADPEVVQVSIFEPPGIQLSPALQREIEKHFTRQELRRVAFDEVGEISYPARVRESYAEDLLESARRADDPRPRLPHRRRLRLLGRVVRAPARARAARRRGRLGARLRVDGRPGAGGLDPASSSSRRGGSCPPSAPTSASSSTAPPSGSTSSTSTGARCRSSRRCSCSCACSPRTGTRGQARVPGHGHEPGRDDRRRQRARGRPHAGLARRPDAGGRGGRRRLRRRRRRRLRLPGASCPPTTRSRACASCSSCSRRVDRPLSELVAELPARRSSTASCPARGR